MLSIEDGQVRAVVFIATYFAATPTVRTAIERRLALMMSADDSLRAAMTLPAEI